MTTQFIRIVDQRQSRKPNYFKAMSTPVVLFAMLFGPGLLAGSTAMQWAGFVVLLAMLFVTLISIIGDSMTIEEAREKLQELDRKG